MDITIDRFEEMRRSVQLRIFRRKLLSWLVLITALTITVIYLAGALR
jgi:hypothetical protein